MISTQFTQKILRTLKSVAKDYFVWGENHRFYPNPPVTSDLAIISLTSAVECVQITSENLLWAKIKKDYPGMFPHLIHRASYNRGKKKLRDVFLTRMELLSEPLVRKEELFIVDSIPPNMHIPE